MVNQYRGRITRFENTTQASPRLPEPESGGTSAHPPHCELVCPRAGPCQWQQGENIHAARWLVTTSDPANAGDPLLLRGPGTVSLRGAVQPHPLLPATESRWEAKPRAQPGAARRLGLCPFRNPVFLSVSPTLLETGMCFLLTRAVLFWP